MASSLTSSEADAGIKLELMPLGSAVKPHFLHNETMGYTACFSVIIVF